MKKILLLAICLFFGSCAKEVKSEQEVYFNDFETGSLNGLTNGIITTYNGTKVLGRYNFSGFDLLLTDLPKHKLVEISFDLYIHDTWDGNRTGNDIDGPDLWKFKVDGNLYINTSFSNAACDNSGFCPPQSYPDTYPNSYHNPKTGAADVSLPGACYLAGQPGGTTLYKIRKVIEHSKTSLLMQCIGELIQTNDGIIPECDESWSVDNLRVKAIDL